MNNTSLSQVRTIAVCILCTLISLVPAQMAQADAAPPPDPTVGGVGPYQPQKTNVQMMAETVFIDVPQSPSDIREPKQIGVSASFTMRNQGQTEEQMQVIFPLTRLGYGEQSLYKVDISSFTVKVNGQPVAITEITTPPEVINYEEVRWAAFPVTFPVKQDVILQVKYEMLNEYGEYGEGFTGIAYILETGAGWYGDILSADISLRLPYPITEDAISQANLGYSISGNEMHWTLKNFEPTRKDNLEVRVIHADVWQHIHELRTRVEKHPDDAETWSELGDEYMRQAVLMREAIYMAFYPHFIELTLEARQKVVDLQPDSGIAHYNLAEILWLGHPGVQSALRQGGPPTAPNPSLEDPTIQKALHELQRAWSLGIQGSLPSLNRVFPELVLTVDTITTVTMVPPTVTLAPLTTTSVPPTVLPTLSPAVSSTPFPISTQKSSPRNTLLLVVLGVLLAGGALIYQLKSRAGS